MGDRSDAVGARAAEAWALMVRDADPMPPYAALDYCRNDLTDDTGAVRRALYGAAADWIRALRPATNDANDFSRRLQEGKFDAARRDLDLFHQYEPGGSLSRETDAAAWLRWRPFAERALALCLELAEL